MSYQTVLNQMRLCLGSASIFSSVGGTAAITLGDDKVYTAGKSPVAVLELAPGLVHTRMGFGGAHEHTWHVPVTVGAQWRDAQNGGSALNAAWQGVLDQICKYPNLGLGAGGTIREAHVASARLEPIVEQYGTLKFASVQLTVVVTEDVAIQEME